MRITIKKMFVTCLLLISSMQTSLKADILHGKGLLWKIEKPGVAPSHIYGTMHSGDPRVVNLQPVVIHAFNHSECFAMEMLLTEDAMQIISHGSFFQDERSLMSIMQPSDYEKLSQVSRYVSGLPELVYSRLRPWALIMFLTSPDAEVEPSESLDMRLYRRALQRNFTLFGLETPEEQLQALETLNDVEQVWLLNQVVAAHDHSSYNMTRMFDAYLDRDLESMVNLQEIMSQNDSDIDDRFMHALLQQRNPRMVERMQNVLSQGKAFIAIGALHLPGDDGVLHLLEQRGYTVTPVY